MSRDSGRVRGTVAGSEDVPALPDHPVHGVISRIIPLTDPCHHVGSQVVVPALQEGPEFPVGQFVEVGHDDCLPLSTKVN
jgi:hypothetical protein